MIRINIKNNKRIIIIFCAIIFILEAGFGFYFGYVKGIILTDAFSRTANAFYVIFVKPPRFASIGLIWNPLPSTVQLPLIALSKFWRPLASSGIAANIVTALFAAITSGILLNTFMTLKISNKVSVIITSLYAFNPFIFFYGCNGMSETIFFTFLVYIICNLTLWLKRGKSKYIITIAFALIGLFFTRYEAIPFAAAIGICLILIIWLSKRERRYYKKGDILERYYYMEGSIILLYTPLFYAIFLWIIFNLVITGNPLYFLNSSYSNVSQSIFSKDFGSLLDTIIYATIRVKPFLILFIGIIIMRIIQKKLLRADVFIISILVSSLIAFHCYMLLKGNSFGWLRFFSYSLPICIAWIPYEISVVKKKYKTMAIWIFVLCLSLSCVLCFRALENPDIAKEEQNLTISQETYYIARYINERLPDKKIMMDSFLTNGIILNINNINNLIVTSSLDFYECLDNPVDNKVDYILVPETKGVGKLDAINQKYIDLYSDGAEWCKEEAEFEGFKLYKVIN